MNDVMLWVIVGLVAGGVAGYLLPGRTSEGALQAIIVGTLGGVFGGFVLDTRDAGEYLTVLGSLSVAAIGAVVLLQVMRSVDQTARI